MPNYSYNSTQTGGRTKGAELINEAFQRWRDSQIAQRRAEEQAQAMQIPPMFEHYKGDQPPAQQQPRSAVERKRGGTGGQAEAVTNQQPNLAAQDPVAVALQVMTLLGPHTA